MPTDPRDDRRGDGQLAQRRHGGVGDYRREWPGQPCAIGRHERIVGLDQKVETPSGDAKRYRRERDPDELAAKLTGEARDEVGKRAHDRRRGYSEDRREEE